MGESSRLHYLPLMVFFLFTPTIITAYSIAVKQDHIMADNGTMAPQMCYYGLTLGGFCNSADGYNPGLQGKLEDGMTIYKGSCGNRRDMKLSDVFTPEELINELVVAMACGGNILINVRPTKEGTFPNILEERLRQIGEWLEVNGEAIYKTVPWIHQNDTVTKDVWYTTTEDKSKIFAMTTKWPGKQLVLGAVNMTIPGQSRVELLGSPGLTMEWEEITGGGLKIMTPRPEDNSSKWAWTFVIIL